MKQNCILYFVCLLATLGLPVMAQTGADTKAAPPYPVMPYKVDTVLTGSCHGKIVITATTPGKPDTDYTIPKDSMVYNTATVKIAVTPDTHYAIRDSFPKVYKKGDTQKTPLAQKPVSGTPGASTFVMPTHFVTIEVAYMELLKNVKPDTLTLTKKPADAAEVLPLLPAKLPVILMSGKTDSVAVKNWNLKSGTTFQTDFDAINRFTCTLIMPDSISANKVAPDSYLDVANLGLITKISTAAQLQEFRNNVNTGYNYADKTVTLAANLDLSILTDTDKTSWTPIGTSSRSFKGTFDGQGFVISGLKINVSGADKQYGGLFGIIGASGTVQNLGITSGTVSVASTGSYAFAGAIAGENFGTVSNCYTNVTVSTGGNSGGADDSSGGIAGYNEGTITNCYTTGAATSTGYAGGIVGNSVGETGLITYCFATGKIKGVTASGIGMGGVQYCMALNTEGVEAIGTGIARRVANGGTILADNYASPSIPGVWTDKGADKSNGADLTEDNLITNPTGDESAFYNWGASWDFTAPANLPKLKTTTGSVINGQTIDRPRADFLVMPITISTSVNYEEAIHKNKQIELTSTGVFTVDAANATISSLDIEQGGQVNTIQELKINGKITTKRTLKNQWITFGTPIDGTMGGTKVESTSFHLLTGYEDATADKQQWVVPSDKGLRTGSPYLLASDTQEEAIISITSTAPGSVLSIPVAQEAPTGEALNTGIFLFKMNPSLCKDTLKNIYVLSDDGTRFELHEVDYVVKPFECYLIANAVTQATVKSLRTGGNLPTGNTPVLPSDAFRIWGADRQLHLDATTPAEVAIYNITGQLLHRFRLDGSRTLTLGRGIYLVQSNNITYKVSL